MKRPYGTPVRGMSNRPSSPFFEGTFGRLLQGLPAAKFSDEALKTEANKMVAPLKNIKRRKKKYLMKKIQELMLGTHISDNLSRS